MRKSPINISNYQKQTHKANDDKSKKRTKDKSMTEIEFSKLKLNDDQELNRDFTSFGSKDHATNSTSKRSSNENENAKTSLKSENVKKKFAHKHSISELNKGKHFTSFIS